MEVELADRPVARKLIAGEVEGQSHWQDEDERVLCRRLVERIPPEAVKEGERLIDAGASAVYRARVLAGVAALAQQLVEWLQRVPQQAQRRFLRLEACEADLRGQREHVRREAGPQQSFGAAAAELRLRLVEEATQRAKHVAVSGDEEVGQVHVGLAGAEFADSLAGCTRSHKLP